MADTEENPHPEDESIEADLPADPEAQIAQQQVQQIAEEDTDDIDDGNGFPEVEADQVSHENIPDTENACSLNFAEDGSEDIDPIADGDGVPEVEADQKSDELNAEKNLNSADNDIATVALKADLVTGNGFPEVEADQMSANYLAGENILTGPEEAPNATGLDDAAQDLEDCQTEDDQASSSDRPCLVGEAGAISLEGFADSDLQIDEENLELDFPAEADLDPFVACGTQSEGNCDISDNSSTESEVKVVEDFEAVEHEREEGHDVEADSGDGFGQVELDAASEAVASIVVDSDMEQNVVSGDEKPQASESGIDVSFEPECDQGPSDNSAHSSQLFCDDDPQLDVIRQLEAESEGLVGDDSQPDHSTNSVDQPEDMVGACAGCDIDDSSADKPCPELASACQGEEQACSVTNLGTEGTHLSDHARLDQESCPNIVPVSDITTSSHECLGTESSQNISIHVESMRNNQSVNSEKTKSLSENEISETESSTALSNNGMRVESCCDLGVDQADVGIELRRQSLDEIPITHVSESSIAISANSSSDLGARREQSGITRPTTCNPVGSATNVSIPHAVPSISPGHSGSRATETDSQIQSDKNLSDTNAENNDNTECDDQLLSELDAMLEDDAKATGDSRQDLPNGLHPELSGRDELESKELKAKYESLAKTVQDQENQIKSQQDKIKERDLQIEDMRRKEHEVLRQASRSNISKTTNDVYLAQVKGLEYTIAQQQKEIKQCKDKLASHDQAAKRAISSLQNELKLRVDQVTKMYQDCLREKDQMVVKYAQAEQKNLELQKTIDKTESKVRDHIKDREVLIGKLKGFSSDKSKLSAQLQNKHSECNSVVKELDKYKDMISSQEVKVKWAQNKLKAELDGHKETKVKLEKMTTRLKEAKEETEQIRRNCQEMIKTYQTSEEIKSNSLDQQLKEKLTQLEKQQHEHKDKEEVHQIVIKELDSLKRKQKDAIAEVKTLRDKVFCLEQERQSQEDTLDKYQNILQNQKTVNRDTISRLQDLESVETEVEKTKGTNQDLQQRLEEMQHVDKETQLEVKLCKNRENELMELTQKLTGKNAQLCSENSSLTTKSVAAAAELGALTKRCEWQEKKISLLSEELAEEKNMRHKEIDLLTKRLDEKSRLVEELTMRVEEEKDENKTIKRKHNANMKDLTRQLQQARKKLETLEQTAGDKDSLSQGSRTSSTNSLDTINTNGQHSSGSGSSNSAATSRASSQEPQHPDPAEPPTVRHIEPDKQMLIERIVKVQRNLARKSEKVEFVEEHNQQLLEELKKKAKIIQNFILREEAGVLTPETMDRLKAQLAKKGGIMASVYSSHPVDGSMTLDLSLEINRKLQAVLEDILLKNITLKENLETLGAEIARLSQENRTIQLKLKGHKS